MLAQARETIPPAGSLPGGTSVEPKLSTGFVLSVVHRELGLSAPAKAPAWGSVGLPGGVLRRGRHRGAELSRGTDMGPAFPEIVVAAGRLPDATAIDCVM